MLKDPQGDVRKAAAQALANFPNLRKQSIPSLIEALDDHEPQVVRAAVISLGLLGKGSDQARKAVARFANDPDKETRQTAGVALANIDPADDSAVPLLVNALGSSEAPLTRLAAVAMAGASPSTAPKLLPALMQNLESGQEPLFKNTLSTLRFMTKQADQSVAGLVDVYDKVKPEKRPQILQALSAMDRSGSQSLPVFLKALKDPDAAARKEALISIARSKQSADHLKVALPEALKDPDADVRAQALGILSTRANTTEGAFPMAITATQDKDPKVRIAALDTLTVFKKPPQDIVQVLERFASEDKDRDVRSAAFAALAGMGMAQKDRVIPLLEKAAEKEQDSEMKGFLNSTLANLRRRTALGSDRIVPGEELGK